MTEPLRFAVDLDCSPAHAFAVWTSGIGTWWPADHTVTGEAGLRVELEGRVGGRVYERTAGGEEHDWGEVTAWEPPSRLAYRWFLRTDRADATDVEICFSSVDGDRTRVEIVHTGWERLGARGPAWRERNTAGWTTLLPHFRAAVAGR
jgi:uncharacterized protein YndB with AHSA1/START domain